MDRRFYPTTADNWDDRIFRDRIKSHLFPEAMVLDFGAGAGIAAAMDFRGCARTICGLDPDPRITGNPFLDEGRIGTGEDIPYSDDTFDVIFANNVLEHLENPSPVFAEIVRVLKPGGVFLAKTPNKFHYVPLIARLTPHSFHQWFNRRRGRAEADTFPTAYRANTPGTIRRLARRHGLYVRQIALVESRPEYLRFNPAIYVLGSLFERLVNMSELFAHLRVVMLIELEKRSTIGIAREEGVC